MTAVDAPAGTELIVDMSAVIAQAATVPVNEVARSAAEVVAVHTGASVVSVRFRDAELHPGGDTTARVPDGATVLPLRAGDDDVGSLTVRLPAGRATGEIVPLLTAAAAILAGALVAAEAVEHHRGESARAYGILDDAGSVLVRLGPDGRLLYVNKAWTVLTGIGYDDAVGKEAMHHVHPDDRVLAAQHMAALIAGDGGSREVRFLSRDGSHRWMEVTGHALLGDDDTIAGFAGILHDVTDRRGAELEARDALSRAEHAQQVAENANRAKSDFLSRMSHELRTPLNAIVGFAELLADSDLADDDRESLGQITVASRLLLGLVTEALDVTRIETGHLPLQLEAVPVDAIVDECLSLMRLTAADHHITLLPIPAHHGGLRAYVDAHRLRQVLLNLLSNAIKYNIDGGRVEIDSYLLDLETPSGPAVPDGWVRITVADGGVGIPADRLDDVFLPFERLGAERTDIPGSGLGLALSRTLVEAMNGHISLYSVPGVGTTFRVDLPAVHEPKLEIDRS